MKHVDTTINMSTSYHVCNLRFRTYSNLHASDVTVGGVEGANNQVWEAVHVHRSDGEVWWLVFEGPPFRYGVGRSARDVVKETGADANPDIKFN